MQKIETLTAKQTAALPAHRDGWLEIGLSTQPGNRTEAQRWIGEAYQVAGLTPPALFVWVDSPMACLCASSRMAGMVECTPGR